jgi:hypothetical protein
LEGGFDSRVERNDNLTLLFPVLREHAAVVCP